MLLNVIQWRWDDGQNPFESIASYSPTQKKLTYINNVTWHTPNNTVSLEGSARGLVKKGPQRCISNSRWGLYLRGRVWGHILLCQLRSMECKVYWLQEMGDWGGGSAYSPAMKCMRLLC